MSKTRSVPEGDLHSSVPAYQSRREVHDTISGDTRRDPATAHKAIGDEGGLQRIPDSCWACEAQALAEQAANKAAGKEEEVDG